MIIQFTFCMIYLVTTNAESDIFKLSVNYYESMIEYETARALTYNLPKNAYEFKAPRIPTTAIGKSYDYIIIGAGSAGAVIATRLSEDPNLSILLLEAGGPENQLTDIPGMFDVAQDLRFNWNFKTIPQTTCCLGMIDNECPYPRGKVLGGSSVLNALMYVRGNMRDYDSWAADGNLGWAYKDILYFFKKSENSQIDGDPGYHGKGGLLNVEYHRPYNPVFIAFMEANVQLGRKILDYNGEQQLGVAATQLNSLEGRRQSTGRSFLTRAANRKNLEILTYSYVTKIAIHKTTKNAYGVHFSREGKSYFAKSNKEVILSAGSLSSPHILMLSGVGPKEHLQEHRIPVLSDVAVGKNLQDHATLYGLYFTSDYAEPVTSLAENVAGYLNDFGPLAIAGNSQGLVFLQTNATKTPGVPDIEVILIPPNSTTDTIKRNFHLTNETYNAVWGKLDPLRSFSFYIMLLHPKSRGSVTLRSANAYDYPLIDANFLSDPEGQDIETIYLGVQLVLQMINTKAFKELNAKLVYNPVPACKKYRYLSKAYWYCQIRELTYHIHHPMGTCKMGPYPAMGAVVDSELKVHGIRNLRVADASIIPLAISGHPSAPAMMIGEKLAHRIKTNLLFTPIIE